MWQNIQLPYNLGHNDYCPVSVSVIMVQPQYRHVIPIILSLHSPFREEVSLKCTAAIVSLDFVSSAPKMLSRAQAMRCLACPLLQFWFKVSFVWRQKRVVQGHNMKPWNLRCGQSWYMTISHLRSLWNSGQLVYFLQAPFLVETLKVDFGDSKNISHKLLWQHQQTTKILHCSMCDWNRLCLILHVLVYFHILTLLIKKGKGHGQTLETEEAMCQHASREAWGAFSPGNILLSLIFLSF